MDIVGEIRGDMGLPAKRASSATQPEINDIVIRDQGADVGVDEGTPVTEDYKEGNGKFTGRIDKVTINITGMKAANVESETQAVHEAHMRKQLAD